MGKHWLVKHESEKLGLMVCRKTTASYNGLATPMGGLCGSFQFVAKYHEFELVWVTTLVRMQLQCQALVATSSNGDVWSCMQGAPTDWQDRGTLNPFGLSSGLKGAKM